MGLIMAIGAELLTYILEHKELLAKQGATFIILFGLLLFSIIRVVKVTQEVNLKYKEGRKRLIRETLNLVKSKSLPYLSSELSRRKQTIVDEYEPKLASSDVSCPIPEIAQCFSFPYYKYKKESLIQDLRLDHTTMVDAIKTSLGTMFHELREIVIDNGYHGKSTEELERWLDRKAPILFSESVDRISRSVGGDNLFIDTNNIRYTAEDSRAHLRDLVKAVIELDEKEKKELRAVWVMIWKG